MKRLPSFLSTVLLFTGIAAAGIKYVAVVETDIDERSGVAAEITSAEVALVTAELRREAVKNLPRGRFSVMTSETVQSMGGAVLEECAEENCVIALGSKIGADYIVRGTISKLRARFTLSVEIYETDNGTLLASSEPIRSESVDELVEKAAAVCAEMFKSFAETQNAAPKPQVAAAEAAASAAPKAPPVTYTVAAAANPPNGGTVSIKPYQESYAPGTRVNLTATPAGGYTFNGWTGDAADMKNRLKNRLTVTADRNKELTAHFSLKSAAAPAAETSGKQKPDYGRDYEAEFKRAPMTGFSLGSSFFPSDGGHSAAQLGVVHSRPITEMISLNVEGNVWLGDAYYSDYESIGFFGLNVPVTALLQWSFFSIEAGVDADMLFGDKETLFNAGFVAGAGVGFSKKRSRRYYYRYCRGINYGAHVVGMRWLF